MAEFNPRLDILPADELRLWPQLRPARDFGFVLYGGTAVALRLGHRHSVDFDFFHSRLLAVEQLRQALPFLAHATPLQNSVNTIVVRTSEGVKVSFFGGLDFGRVRAPDVTTDGVTRVASLEDLMATTLKVMPQRNELKDYRDIAAMIAAKVSVAAGLAAATKMFHPTFPPGDALRAMVYFEEGDVVDLKTAERNVLVKAAGEVTELPAIHHSPDLAAPSEATLAPAEGQAPKTPRVSL